MKVNSNYAEIQTHLLVLILKAQIAQIELLNRLTETPMLVARPPMRVYSQPTKRIARPPEQEKKTDIPPLIKASPLE